jgi:hypothetical protein
MPGALISDGSSTLLFMAMNFIDQHLQVMELQSENNMYQSNQEHVHGR